MNFRRIRAIIFCLFNIIIAQNAFSQQNPLNSGRISGDLNLNANFYELDSARNTQGISFYDYLKSGAESWFSVKYSNKAYDFEAGIRFDLYNNSNRIFPTNNYSEQGIGNWYVQKKIGKLEVTGGYFYDQIGSGAIFRANEQRLIGIDRAVYGLRAFYELPYNITIKGFTGKQKYLFDTNSAIIKGLNLESYINKKNITLTPGIGIINRTLDINTVNSIYDQILIQPEVDEAFTTAKYRNNTIATSIYNTLSFKSFNWFVEYAFKTPEAVNTFGNKWEYLDGNFILTNLTYSTKGFGITLQAKRTENFRLRTDPLNKILQNNVYLNYLPAINKEHSLLLLARYPAQSLELDEFALAADLVYSPNKEWKFELSASNITLIDSDSLLYREIYFETSWKKRKSPLKLHAGVQILDYNDIVYRQKEGYVNNLTPFIEAIYKLNRKTALRFEGEYLMSQRKTRFKEGFDAKLYKQDRNDWYNIMLELTISPNWSFSVSDLYNINPPNKEDQLHYPGVFTSFTRKASRFSLFYGKRVDGIVCSGGVCRFEPAFSGIQFQLSTSF